MARRHDLVQGPARTTSASLPSATVPTARPTLLTEARRVADGLAGDGRLATVHVLLAGRLRCLAAPGAAGVHDGGRPGDDATGRALRSGTTVVVDGARTGQVCAPVLVEGGAVAVVGLTTRTPPAPSDVAAAEAAAADLARAVAALGGLPASPTQRLAALALELRADSDRERMRRVVVEGAAELSRCPSAVLVRRLPDGGWLVSAATGPLAAAASAWTPQHLAAVTGRVDPSTTLLLAPDGDEPDLRFLADAGVRSVHALALQTSGQVGGVLLCLGDAPAPPDPSVAAALELFASVAAGNLLTARLTAELAERREEALARLGTPEQLRDDLTDACIDAIRGGEVHRTYLLLALTGPLDDPAVVASLAEAVNGQLRHGDALYRTDGEAQVAVLLATRTAASAAAVAGRLVRSAATVGVRVRAGWSLVDGPPAVVVREAERSLASADEDAGVPGAQDPAPSPH